MNPENENSIEEKSTSFDFYTRKFEKSTLITVLEPPFFLACLRNQVEQYIFISTIEIWNSQQDKKIFTETFHGTIRECFFNLQNGRIVLGHKTLFNEEKWIIIDFLNSKIKMKEIDVGPADDINSARIDHFIAYNNVKKEIQLWNFKGEIITTSPLDLDFRYPNKTYYVSDSKTLVVIDFHFTIYDGGKKIHSHNMECYSPIVKIYDETEIIFLDINYGFYIHSGHTRNYFEVPKILMIEILHVNLYLIGLSTNLIGIYRIEKSKLKCINELQMNTFYASSMEMLANFNVISEWKGIHKIWDTKGFVSTFGYNIPLFRNSDSITIAAWYGAPLNIQYGQNLKEPNIFYSNVSRLDDVRTNMYNGFRTIFYFDLDLMKKYLLNSEDELEIEAGANFYTKPSMNRNGTLFWDNLWTEKRVFNLKKDNIDFTFVDGMVRWEFYHPAIYSLSLAFHLVLVVIVGLFSRVQPLKAHGLLPLTTIIILTLKFISQLVHFFPFVLTRLYFTPTNLLWYFSEVVRYGGVVAICMVYPLNLIRFLILTFLNYRKSISNGEQNKKCHIKILLILGNGITFPIIQLSMFVLIIIIGFTSYFLIYIQVQSITYRVLMFFLAIITMFLMMIDMFFLSIHVIKWIQKKRKKWEFILFPWHFLRIAFVEDVLYFRIQIYGIGLFLLFPTFVINQIYNLALPQEKYLFLTLSSMAEYLFIFFGCLFFTIISIFNFFRNIGKTKKHVSAIQGAMENEKLWELFTEFSELEFALENVKCYEDIQKFKKLKSEAVRVVHIEKIEKVYLSSSSDLEVNVSNKVRKQFDIKKSEKIDESFFEDIEREIVENLSDTWSRFVVSYQYQNFYLFQNMLKQTELQNQ
eukprot:gene5618-9435_t